MSRYMVPLLGGSGSAIVGYAAGLAWWQTFLVVLPTIVAVTAYFGRREHPGAGQ